jgi:hypothetical protein
MNILDHYFLVLLSNNTQKQRTKTRSGYEVQGVDMIVKSKKAGLWTAVVANGKLMRI